MRTCIAIEVSFVLTFLALSSHLVITDADVETQKEAISDRAAPHASTRISTPGTVGLRHEPTREDNTGVLLPNGLSETRISPVDNNIVMNWVVSDPNEDVDSGVKTAVGLGNEPHSPGEALKIQGREHLPDNRDEITQRGEINDTKEQRNIDGIHSSLSHNRGEKEFDDYRKSHGDISKCPPCNCSTTQDSTHTRAKCEGDDITQIPEQLPDYIWTLEMLSTQVRQLSFNKLSLYPNISSVNVNNATKLSKLVNYKSSALHSSLLYLNLDKNNIHTVEDYSLQGFPVLKNLSLRHNDLRTIGNYTLAGLKKLKHLDLSENLIDFLDFGAFDHSPYLVTLNLSNNQFFVISDQNFPPRLFENVYSLTNLFLERNNVSESGYPLITFGTLKTLNWLTIDGISNPDPLGPELRNLKDLRRLEFGVNRGYCNIGNITKSYFKYVPQLRELTFQFCRYIHSIHEQAFSAIPYLETLNFRYTVGYQLTDIFSDLRGLVNHSLSSLTINGAIDNSPPCMFLDEEDAKYLQHLKLKSLDLSYNHIAELKEDFCEKLPPSLERLVLRHNQFNQYGWILGRLSFLGNLTHVDLSDQNVEKMVIPKNSAYGRVQDTSKCKEAAKERYREKLCRTPKESTDLPECHRGSDFTQITFVPDQSTQSPESSSSESTVNIPPQLQVIQANRYMHFGDVIMSKSLQTKNSLKELYFSNSFLGKWGMHRVPPLVIILDLSDNNCKHIRPDFFSANNSLIHVDIRSNFLGSDFAGDENGAILANLTKVNYINIETNLIYHLPFHVFRGLKSVRYLDISDNKLQALNISLAHCKDLQLLNASMNSIGWISRQVREDLDNIAQRHAIAGGLVLDVTLNPLPCTCAGIEVLEWLAKTHVSIHSADFLQCRLDDSRIEQVGKLWERVLMLKRRCSTQADLFAICVGTVGIIITFLAMSLAYRYRWRLFYWKNVRISKMFGYQPTGAVDTSAGSHSHYDAFIVHTQTAYEFVLGEMRRQLIQQRGHKLCIPDIDFLPGSFTVLNTFAAVRESRVTLLVVTPDLVEDDRAMYALKMALVDEMYRDQDGVFLLILNYTAEQNQELEGSGNVEAGEEAEREQLIGDYRWVTSGLLPVIQRGSFIEFPVAGRHGVTPEVFQTAWDRISHRIGDHANSDIE